MKSGAQPDTDMDDSGEDSSIVDQPAPVPFPGIVPKLTAEGEGLSIFQASSASVYTPTSPLSASQPSSMRSFMKLSSSHASSLPGSAQPPPPAPPLQPGRSGMKRKDSFVSSTGQLLDVRCITPVDGKVDLLTHLPYEIAMVIVIYADFPAIMTISQVSRSWNRFAHDNAVWRRLFLQQREWRTPRALATAGCHSRKRSGGIGSGLVRSGNATPLPIAHSNSSNNTSGISTPRVGDELTTAASSPNSSSSMITTRILSAYSGSSLRPAINLQHMVAPSPTPSMVGGFGDHRLQLPRRPASDWRYLFQQRLLLDRNWTAGDADVQVISGHGDSVYCVQYDHDKIVTGSRDRTVKVWDSSSFECLRTLAGHDASVLCLKYDDTALVTGSSDATIIVWDWETGTPQLRLSSHAAGVLDVAFDSEHIVSCSKDCTIKVWRRSSGKLLRTMAGHRGPVNAVQLHGNRIVSASGDSLIKMWDLKTGELIRTFTGHTRGLACVQFDGKTIVSGSSDQHIKVWDAETGHCKQTLRGHKDLVRTLHFAGGRRAVSGSYDQTIKVWDIVTGQCILDLKDVHTSWVFDVQFSASRIVSTSQDQKIIIWDFSKGLDVEDIN
ncbi:hypothetical protein GGF46_001486 [Coemansia sp. RSA 552]|nr:hypothetical protein GGF46_001486 [Coemansia sp. RSA 552]